MTLAVLIDGYGRRPGIFIAVLAYCLHATLRARPRPLALGRTARTALDRLAAVQMLVHFPTTDGRTLILSRYTELNSEQSSWSSSSSSTYRRNRRRVAPHRNARPRSSPPPCSRDLGPGPLDPAQLFLSVEKVGLGAAAPWPVVAWARQAEQVRRIRRTHACKMGLEGIVSKRSARATARADRRTRSSSQEP
jgi:hypothetical protein